MLKNLELSMVLKPGTRRHGAVQGSDSKRAKTWKLRLCFWVSCSNNVLQHHGHGVTMETLSPPADLYVLWTSSRAFDHYLLTICFSVIAVTQPAGLSEKVSGDSGLQKKDLC